MNLRFLCTDAATDNALTDCSIRIQIVEETPVRELTVNSNVNAPIVIPVKRRLVITAQHEGYKPATDIFEYVEDGTQQTRNLRLEKNGP